MWITLMCFQLYWLLLCKCFMHMFIGNKYNPLTAVLRTLGKWIIMKVNLILFAISEIDTYFVGSLGELDHAAVSWPLSLSLSLSSPLNSPTHSNQIVVFTFILGGLIGVVQKSGGGIGLGRLLHRFTSTRRRLTNYCSGLPTLNVRSEVSLHWLYILNGS